MILCVAPSPAIDVTYEVAGFAVGGTNRVTNVVRRPGGKAVNVARVLTTLGEPTVVLAPVGDESGAEFTEELAALGVAAELVDACHPTRQTLTVVDTTTGQATLLSEQARIQDWTTVSNRFAALLPAADVVVISGSVPSGAPSSAIAELVVAATSAGRPVIVDTSGRALVEAVAVGPTIVKPNADELAELTGLVDPVAAVRSLLPLTVVASLGARGVVVADADGVWQAAPGCELRGNPTGAGDALVAGLARGLAHGVCLSDSIADAVALSAAAVLAPFAGEVDPAEVRRQRAAVSVRRSEVAR